MQGRPDREWEYWPTRGQLDDRPRSGLRALFSSTDRPENVEALIAERGREIEERTEELRRTIADLEHREEQTHRLRAAVEEMLRHDSAELDDRHAELTALAAELGTRDERLAAAEHDLAERRRELGAVELRRAAVERREADVAERESALEQIAGGLGDRERSLTDAERKIAELVAREAELDARRVELEADEARLRSLIADAENARRALSLGLAALEHRESRVADLEARRRELDRGAGELATQAEQLEVERAAIATGRVELARAVAAVSSGLGLGPSTASPAGPDPAHVLFVPGERYRIEHVDGPVPPLDAVIELAGARYRVVRIGRSPLPADTRPCAFVETITRPSDEPLP